MAHLLPGGRRARHRLPRAGAAPDEAAVFEQHLNFCDGCLWYVDQVRTTVDGVGELARRTSRGDQGELLARSATGGGHERLQVPARDGGRGLHRLPLAAAGRRARRWVDADVDPCRSGVHACRAPTCRWVGRTLYEIELDGEILEDRMKVVASRGRLLRRVTPGTAWPTSTRACAPTARTSWRAGRARKWEAVVEPSVPEGGALLGFVAARIAEAVDGEAAYHRERARQAEWLVERLGLRPYRDAAADRLRGMMPAPSHSGSSVTAVAATVVLGLWVSGGVITDDFSIAMWLTVAWTGRPGLAAVGIAWRSRSVRWPSSAPTS